MSIWTTSFATFCAVGEPALIIALEVFLEAKAVRGHTCIAGGLFKDVYTRKMAADIMVRAIHCFDIAVPLRFLIFHSRQISLLSLYPRIRPHHISIQMIHVNNAMTQITGR